MIDTPASTPTSSTSDLAASVEQLLAESTRHLQQRLGLIFAARQAELEEAHARAREAPQALVEKTARGRRRGKAAGGNGTLAARREPTRQESEQLRQRLQSAEQQAAQDAARQQADAEALAASRDELQRWRDQEAQARGALDGLQAELDEALAARDAANRVGEQQAERLLAQQQAHAAELDALGLELESLRGELGEANSNLSELKIRLWNAEAESE